MNKKIRGALALLSFVTIATGTLFQYTSEALAAPVSSHVRVVGSTKTVWFGDVTIEGCSITDATNQVHTFTQPFAICALDAAADAGGFSYAVKDFGGALGLFLQSVGSDSGADDFSTYWSYDLNGTAASQGISNQLVTDGDSVYFHFEDPSADVNTRAINDGVTYLRSEQQTSGQINGFAGITDWAAMTFSAAGINPDTIENGGTSLVDYLAANQPTTSSSATEWERAILAITAAEDNPYAFGGTNYVQNLASYHNNSQIGVTTQVNDDVFGLLALIAAGVDASEQIKQDALDFILSEQNADGGFSWSTTGDSAIDDTASTVQALIAAQNAGLTGTNLTTAITNAQNYLLAAQNSDGGFPYTPGEVSNASSTAWAVMALSALGITGEDLTTAKAYLRGTQEENGSFKWQPTSTGDTFTTSYAVLALTGKYWPVKMYESSSLTPTAEPTAIPTAEPSLTGTPAPTESVPTSTPVPSVTVNPSPKQGESTMQKRMQRAQLLRERLRARLDAMLERMQAKFGEFTVHIIFSM